MLKKIIHPVKSTKGGVKRLIGVKKSKTKKVTKKKVTKKAVKKPAKKKTIKKKVTKTPVKKLVEKAPAKKEKPIGKVIHYFNNIKVGVIKLSQPIKVSDSIRIVGGEVDFKQKVASMEIDHKKVKLAKKGKVIGLKLKGKAREGYKVYKA